MTLFQNGCSEVCFDAQSRISVFHQHEAIAGVLAEPDVTAVHHYAGPREMETAIGRDIRRVTHTLGASASPTSTLTRVRNDGPAAVVTGIPEGCVVPRTPYQRQALQTGSSRLPQRTSVPAHTNHKYTPVHTSEAEVKHLPLACWAAIFNSCHISRLPRLL